MLKGRTQLLINAILNDQEKQSIKSSNIGVTGKDIGGRVDSIKGINIVNDGGNNNTSIGIIEFNIGNYINKDIFEAIFTTRMNSTWFLGASKDINNYNEYKDRGIDIYYSLNDLSNYTTTSYLNDNNFEVGQNHNSVSNNLNRLGVSEATMKLGTILYSSVTNYVSLNITEALIKAQSNNKNKFYIILATDFDGTTGEPWTDAWFAQVDQSITISYKRSRHSKSEINKIRENITQSKFNNAPYKGTSQSAIDGSYSVETLTGDDEMSNVLWSYGVGSDAAFAPRNDNDYWAAGIQFGQTTLLYDGVNDMAFPINFYIKRTQGGWPAYSSYSRQPVSVYADSSYAQLKHNWHGVRNYDSSGAGYAYSTQYGLNTVDSKTASTPTGYDMPATEQDYYSNTLYINGSSLSFSNNLAEISGIKFNFYVNQTNNNENKTGNVTVSGENQRIRIIDYSKIYSAIQEAKNIYNQVIDNEISYDSTDLYNFYEAFNKLISFNPNDYFTSNNNYEECARAIKELENYVLAAKTWPRLTNIKYSN